MYFDLHYRIELWLVKSCVESNEEFKIPLTATTQMKDSLTNYALHLVIISLQMSLVYKL